jgi:serine O-acetyltransferase
LEKDIYQQNFLRRYKMFLCKAVRQIKEDVQTIYDKDPAANNLLEVLLCYPGLQALFFHRLAYKLKQWKIPLIPRIISNFSRWMTGIDIHPSAVIGKRVFIDHGFGVVIGETAVIGDDVLIYQGVTLGGTGKECGKRHPTLKDNVIVGAGAKVLGNVTVGCNSRIGAGSVVIEDIPENCTVVGIPGRIVHQKVCVEGQLMHNIMPDPVKCHLKRLAKEIEEIKEHLNLHMEPGIECPEIEL